MNFAKRLTIFLHKDIKLGIRALILCLSGVLTGLTIAFPQIGFLQWIAIVPAGVILLRRASHHKTKLRSSYFDGLVFFYSYYLVCYHFFLSMYPLDFLEGMTNGTAAAVVVISWFGLSLLQALQGAFVFVFCGVVFRSRICKRVSLLKPVFVAALWAIFEWIQNFGWWGVPWGKLALGQTAYVVGIQNASWLGSYFITFVIVLVNMCVALAILKASKERIVRSAATVALCTIVFQYATGTLIWFTTDIDEGETVKVACVQGNISSTDEWMETYDDMRTVYSEQTRLAAEQGAKIIVWPETVLPFDVTKRGYSRYDNMCKDLANETGAYILVGAYSTQNELKYNSILCYTPEGERMESEYHKRRLVPFGEFVPMRDFFEVVIPPLTELISSDDCMAGEDVNMINVDGVDVGALLCFDSIYDGLTLDTVREGADFICLSTNDSWFLGSAALGIHRSQAQLRAVESGRYIARCASTGISSVISPRGEILEELGEDSAGYIIYDIHKRDSKTVWYYVGNSFVYLCIAFCAVALFDRVAQRVRKSKKIDRI